MTVLIELVELLLAIVPSFVSPGWNWNKQVNSVLNNGPLFFNQNGNTEKHKLTVVARKTLEQHLGTTLRNNQSPNTAAPQINEAYLLRCHKK